MAREQLQTVGDLRQKSVVTADEIADAVEAYLSDPTAGPYRFASGHVLDVKSAVDDHRPTKAALAVAGTGETFRRTMIRTAVILAVPVMGSE